MASREPKEPSHANYNDGELESALLDAKMMAQLTFDWIARAVGCENAGTPEFGSVIPVDLHIRGCPPRPEQLLKGLLALVT